MRLAPYTLTIDGVPVAGTLSMDQEWIDVSVSAESRPDPSWELRDAAGHFHAWAEDGTLPTLKSVAVHMLCSECGKDDCCDGWDSTERRCILCDEVVKPTWIVDTNPPWRQMPGRKDWVAEVAYEVPIGRSVSIVLVTEGHTYFGFGKAFSSTVSPDGPSSRLQCGPMSKRLTSGPATDA